MVLLLKVIVTQVIPGHDTVHQGTRNKVNWEGEKEVQSRVYRGGETWREYHLTGEIRDRIWEVSCI